MTQKRVTDEEFGKLCRRTDELIRRVDEGTLSYDGTMVKLQGLIEGKTNNNFPVIDCGVKKGNGGGETAIHCLTTKDGGKDLESIAKIIVNKREQTFPIIDCDSDPYIPKYWELEGHIKSGQIVFDPKTIELYVSDKQKDDHGIQGMRLFLELLSLKGKTILNVNVLDFLIEPENWKYIPENWKDKRICFWGTVYRTPDGRWGVRQIFWREGWRQSYAWFEDYFVDYGRYKYVAALASAA